MTRFILKYLPALLLLTAAASAQTSIDTSLTGLTVNYIVIHGNDYTKEKVILRELKQQVDQPLDPALVEEDAKRLQNLHIFNRVIILAEPYQEGVLLRILVTEMWYVYPFPILYINDKDWSKFSYGAGISHLNFRGNAETVGFTGWLGYDPGLSFAYTNPWFGGELRLNTSVTFTLNKIRSKHFQKKIDENHAAFNWSLGKRFGYHIFFNIDLGGKRVSFSPAVEGSTISGDGVDFFPAAGLRFQWDRRDLVEYPHRGWLIAAGIRQSGIPGGTIDYLRFAWDTRAYLPLTSGITFALRNATLLSSGEVPLYDRVYFGYSERIRGHFSREISGECRSIASAALRFPLLPVRYFSLADSPYMSNMKFGISMGLFADAGLIWEQSEKPSTDKILSGYGVGLHFHLPYINLIRLELAFDEHRNSQYILDLYTAF